ncbi:DUF397 domain-containing protein [Saccharopolyspora phatthalungensis]|uniref:DUF397 domain-containing protein n=1 Tax=Saccharopolyspora phatthalungensis TaxID=664693 RepID=UPI00160C73C8|nr:DUF397 domain-containing protein [Saccharopolyspora phatthalungensis]
MTSSEKENCVEIGGAPGFAGVRDTKDRASGTLVFDMTAWGHFLSGVKADRFDTPQG